MNRRRASFVEFRNTTPDVFFAIGLTLVATVLASLYLGDKALWLDEALSVQRAGGTWRALWHDITSTQANMGLYYVLLHGWIGMVGTTEAAIRSLSVVFAAAAMPVIFVLARKLFGSRAALAALALLAFNAFLLRYGQEARGYSLLMLLSALSTLAFVRALEQPGSSVRWAAYVLAGALTMYAHLFGALVLAAHAVALALPRRRSLPWRPLIVAGASIAVLVSPLMWFAIAGDVGQIDWIPAPRAVDLAFVFRSLTGDAGWALAGIVAAACVLTLWPRATAQQPDGAAPPAIDPVALAGAWLVVPVALAFAVSFAKPVFQPRYLIVALPPLMMLAGAGVARLPSQAMGFAAMAAMLALSAIGVRDWRGEPDRQFWRRAVEFVAKDAQPGDAVGFFVYSARAPFEYYVDRLGARRADVALVDLSSDPFVAGNHQPDPSGAVLNDLAAHRSRVWLVRLQDATPPGHPLGRYEQGKAIEAALGQSLTRTVDAKFTGGIRVQRYDRYPEFSR